MDQLQPKPELVFKRQFPAPPEKVWRYWTEAELMQTWFAPNGFTAATHQVDARVGGRYLSSMKNDDGSMEVWSTGTYLEIVPYEKLVLTDSFADPDGHVVHAEYYGMNPNYPLENRVTVTFEADQDQTRFVLTYHDASSFPADDLRDMRVGWDECLDKLAAQLVI